MKIERKIKRTFSNPINNERIQNLESFQIKLVKLSCPLILEKSLTTPKGLNTLLPKRWEYLGTPCFSSYKTSLDLAYLLMIDTPI